MEFISSILATLGIGSAATGSQACHWFILDEAECPESLIK